MEYLLYIQDDMENPWFKEAIRQEVALTNEQFEEYMNTDPEKRVDLLRKKWLL